MPCHPAKNNNISLQICMHFHTLCRGGGSSTMRSAGENKGRAAGETPTAIIGSATAAAPESFFPDLSPIPHTYIQASLSSIGNTAICPVCTEVLERPLELTCDRMVCLGCLVQWIQVSSQLACPCCHGNRFDSTHFRTPSAITMGVLGSLSVTCQVCNRVVQAQHYSQHLTPSVEHTLCQPALHQKQQLGTS